MRMTIRPGDDLAALVRDAARRLGSDSLVVVLQPSGDALADAIARASIAPLEVKCAPGLRINAVAARDTAMDADIDAAVLFLDAARSTTGQIIEIG